MVTVDTKVSLNGIWHPRETPISTARELSSSAPELARHVVNTQGLERLSSRPVETIADEIQGTNPFGDLRLPGIVNETPKTN